MWGVRFDILNYAMFVFRRVLIFLSVCLLRNLVSVNTTQLQFQLRFKWRNFLLEIFDVCSAKYSELSMAAE